MFAVPQGAVVAGPPRHAAVPRWLTGGAVPAAPRPADGVQHGRHVCGAGDDHSRTALRPAQARAHHEIDGLYR